MKTPHTEAIASYFCSIVIRTTNFLPIPDDVLQSRVELDTHDVISQCVPPTRPAWLRCVLPKFLPISKICESGWEYGTPFVGLGRKALGQRSYEKASVREISCVAAVNDTVAASARPNEGRHASPVSENHLVVLPATMAVGKARCLQNGGMHPPSDVFAV